MSTDPVYRSPSARAAVLTAYDAAVAAWPVAATSRFVETSFGRTHVLECGPKDAPPLVLLHGGGGSAIDWRFNVADLAGACRCILLDIVGEPGHSMGVRPRYASRGHVAWLDEVRGALGLETFALAGASLGAWVAWQYALAHPDRVSAVVLVSPPNLAPMRKRFLFRAIVTALAPTTGNIRRFQRGIFSPATPPLSDEALAPGVTRWRAQRSGPKPIPLASLEEIRNLPQSAIVLVGADEPLYDVAAAARRFDEAGAREKLQIVPNGGHALPFERADEVDRQILALVGGRPKST